MRTHHFPLRLPGVTAPGSGGVSGIPGSDIWRSLFGGFLFFCVFWCFLGCFSQGFLRDCLGFDRLWAVFFEGFLLSFFSAFCIVFGIIFLGFLRCSLDVLRIWVFFLV